MAIFRVLCAAAVLALAAATTILGAERGNDPEAVFSAFADCVRKGDFAGAMEMFPCRETARHASSSLAHIGKLGVTRRDFQLNEYPEYEALNVALQRARAAEFVLDWVNRILLPEELAQLLDCGACRAAGAASPEAVRAMIAAMNPERLESLRVARMVPDAGNLANAIPGHRAFRVLLKLGNEFMTDCIVMARYGEKWFVSWTRLSGMGGFAEVSATRVPVRGLLLVRLRDLFFGLEEE